MFSLMNSTLRNHVSFRENQALYTKYAKVFVHASLHLLFYSVELAAVEISLSVHICLYHKDSSGFLTLSLACPFRAKSEGELHGCLL